jgi:AcrR family transcriptional regulator
LPRDRFATRALIIETAASIISARGVAALGVNSLADAANCDKVLIYRYFGGLDGVLAALGVERMLWPRVELGEDDATGGDSLADAVQSLLLEEWAALSGSALMLASAGAELSAEGRTLGLAASKQRAELHGAMIGALRENHQIPPYVDLPALVELLSAALTTFALRSAHAPAHAAAQSGSESHVPPFDPGSPHGWRRIEKMLAAITRALLDSNGR